MIRENFEYKNVGKLRFIGMNLKLNPDISYDETIEKISPLLDQLSDYASDISDYCFLEHYQGQWINEDYITRVTGKFFKPDTPIPHEFCDFKNINGYDGLYYYDIPTINIARGIYCGDDAFSGDTFDAYVITRDQILRDKIEIPFPQAYWTAVQFIDGEPKKGNYRFGYIFGVGDIK